MDKGLDNKDEVLIIIFQFVLNYVSKSFQTVSGTSLLTSELLILNLQFKTDLTG